MSTETGKHRSSSKYKIFLIIFFDLVYQDIPNKEKAVKLTFEDLEFEVNVVLTKEE